MTQYVVLCALLTVPFLSTASDVTIQLSFYGAPITLTYDKSMLLHPNVPVKEAAMTAYYREMEKASYQPLLNSLQAQRAALKLNDWLYYRLMQQAVAQVMPQASITAQRLTCWLLLAKSGYDVRIAYFQGKVDIYAYTDEEIFEAPIIEDGGRSLVNLSSISFSQESEQPLYMVSLLPNPQGRAFSFDLGTLPAFSPTVVQRELRFTYQGEPIYLRVEADENLKTLMSDYPVIGESKYLEAPLSATLQASLLPQLAARLKGKTAPQSLSFLAALTRSAFVYKEDKEYFGHSKPLVSDELFLYPYSDCEDRCALFYQLVKSLLDLPMIVIAYHDHLSIAVALDDMPGAAPLRYKGRNYYICDPTGPSNSDIIGRAPTGYANQKLEVIHAYK